MHPATKHVCRFTFLWTYMQGKSKARLRELALTASGSWEEGFAQPSLRPFPACLYFVWIVETFVLTKSSSNELIFRSEQAGGAA